MRKFLIMWKDKQFGDCHRYVTANEELARAVFADLRAQGNKPEAIIKTLRNEEAKW